MFPTFSGVRCTVSKDEGPLGTASVQRDGAYLCKSYEGIWVSFECKKKELKLGVAERDLIFVDLPFLRSLPEGPL